MLNGKKVLIFFTNFQGQTKYTMNRENWHMERKETNGPTLLDQSILLASLDIINTIKR